MLFPAYDGGGASGSDGRHSWPRGGAGRMKMTAVRSNINPSRIHHARCNAIDSGALLGTIQGRQLHRIRRIESSWCNRLWLLKTLFGRFRKRNSFVSYRMLVRIDAEIH